MIDIRLATDFLSHPKTVMLQADHGAEAVLALLRLWSFAAVYRTKGVSRGLNKERIAVTAGCSIEVIDAMIGEFIDEGPDGVFKLDGRACRAHQAASLPGVQQRKHGFLDLRGPD